MPLVTTVDPDLVATALGRPPLDQTSPTYYQWDMWIMDALMLIQDRADTITPAPTVNQAKLDYVIREAVKAHVNRPEDVTQVTVSVDDGSTSKTYRSGSGRVMIRDEWWGLLGLAVTAAGPYSVDTCPAASVHTPWCALAFGAVYCSCGSDIAGYPIYELP